MDKVDTNGITENETFNEDTNKNYLKDMKNTGPEIWIKEICLENIQRTNCREKQKQD